jgi:MFS family permease
MFSLFAYAPLFLQGALAQTPMVVGYAMLSLSLGWSMGSLIMGRMVDRVGAKKASLAGSLLLTLGTCLCLGFTRETSLIYCFFVFIVTGLGMGFITLSTLLIVQDSVDPKDLGLATSFHQFSRTFGGTVGVGICGSVVTSRLFEGIEKASLSGEMVEQIRESMAHLFQPEFRALIPAHTLDLLQAAVLDGVWAAFAIVAGVSILGLGLGFFLPSRTP